MAFFLRIIDQIAGKRKTKRPLGGEFLFLPKMDEFSF